MFLLILAAFMAAGDIRGDDFLLVDNGRAQSVIYLTPNRTEVAEFAARELQKYLAEATGVPLAIVDSLPSEGHMNIILVGPSEEAAKRGATTGALEPEGYHIKSGANWLAIVGDDLPGDFFLPLTGAVRKRGQWSREVVRRYGTLSGVYRFLHDQYGFRWFMPGELGTVIPELPTAAVTAWDTTDAPAFRDRAIKLSPNVGDHVLPSDGEVGQWVMKTGYGRSFPSYFGHTFYYLTRQEKEKLSQNKPHIFAVLPDGSRDFDTTSYGDGNLCLSEPDTLTEFVRVARHYLDDNPGLREFSVVPNDVWVPCTCDNCLSSMKEERRREIRRQAQFDQRGGTMVLPRETLTELRSASEDVYWGFVAKVAHEIYESHPDRLVGVLGDYYVTIPSPEIEFPPNLAVCITKTRSEYWDRDIQEQTYDLIRRWHTITPHIYVWEYYLWNIRPWRTRPVMNGYPIFFPRLLAEDMDFMKEYMKGGKIQMALFRGNHAARHLGTTHGMLYLTGKLLYNPDLNIDDVLDDYYRKFYGQARAPMQTFWELAEESWMRDTRDMTSANEIIETMFPASVLRRMFDLLDEAKSLVAPASLEYRRIELIEEEMSVHRARTLRDDERLLGPWYFRADPDGKGLRQKWFLAPPRETAQWKRISVPDFWADTWVGDYLGYGWYKNRFTLPQSAEGQSVNLSFQGVDEQAWVFLNGEWVGEHSEESEQLTIGQLWNRPFSITIEPEFLRPGEENLLVVRVHGSRGNAGIWQPVSLELMAGEPAHHPSFNASAVFPAPSIHGEFQDHWSDQVIVLKNHRGLEAEPQTFIKVGHDNQNLYVTIHALEDGTAPLPVEADHHSDQADWHWRTRHGYTRPIGASNTLEIQLQPDPDKPHFAQIMLNAKGGVLAEFYHHPDYENARDWDSGISAQTIIQESGWTATIAIPWPSLGRSLSPGMEIKANFIRWRAGAGTSAWSSMPDGWDDHDPWRQGRSIFGSIWFLEE